MVWLNGTRHALYRYSRKKQTLCRTSNFRGKFGFFSLLIGLFEIKNLNYIFVSDVYNEETLDFIKEIFKEAIDIQWPYGKSDVQTPSLHLPSLRLFVEQPQTWENGSPEFYAIL